MADPVINGEAEEELVDYEEDEGGEEAKADGKSADQAKAGYVGIHSSGFKDFLLKPELLRAIVDCGFEHPSEGEHYALYMLGAVPSLLREHGDKCSKDGCLSSLRT